MSVEFREGLAPEPSDGSTLLDRAPGREGMLLPEVPPGLTIVERLQQLRWIHIPIITVMATAGMLVTLPRQTHTVGVFRAHDVLYLLSLPYVFLAIWGLLTRTPPLPTEEQRTLDRLIICLVTKGSNPEVVLRTYRSLLPLCGPQVELCVVTDKSLPIPHLLVPETFRTRYARYKARALEYFRQQQRFGPGDWVLHLDEESVLDARGLHACQEYCRRSPYLYGQGPIFYNNHDFWQHPVEAAADCIRAADDVAKFHLQLARLRWPIFGLHGSFLLVKGSLEDEITWDLQGSLVEDYAFAVECMRRGLGVGEVEGIVREQSPKTVPDFLRQRRRWLVGIRGLSRMSPWARLWTLLWSASPLVRAATVADVLGGHGLPLAMLIAGNFISASFLYLYLMGSVIQDIDRRTPIATLLWHALLTGILFPVSYTLESVAVLWSFVSREQRIGFETVQK
jgi:cellulose synthase/poly-beta-1,6-N-acetylglucosamine synthase-like glycosyltransferase